MCQVGFDCVSCGPETETRGHLTEWGMYRMGQLLPEQCLEDPGLSGPEGCMPGPEKGICWPQGTATKVWARLVATRTCWNSSSDSPTMHTWHYVKSKS